MTHALPTVRPAELPGGDREAGLGTLSTARGNLPLEALDVRARIDGLAYGVEIVQEFANPFDAPIEVTYIFPLPERAAVSRFRMEVGDRTIEGVIKERDRARREYREAVEAGLRAAIAEEERPDIFTMRVGNILPGERARVRLDLDGLLALSGDEATFRFPLVVAPRYIPGSPLPGRSVGKGVSPDTDEVPDASRITPPVLLPGFPGPVRLSLRVEVRKGGLEPRELRSSLHAVISGDEEGARTVELRPGERLDRDFILRFRVGGPAIATALSLVPDPPEADGGAGEEGTFLLTLVPPADASSALRPRDVALVLDRSGSMEGWKIVAARRAMARVVDTLGERDRFCVLAFDDALLSGPLGAILEPATDRNRFRTVQFLSAIDAGGGTEMAAPLVAAVDALGSGGGDRDRILVLVTDGQVGNEDGILASLGGRLAGIRVFTLGIDRAVNAGFLERLSRAGGGLSEVVESEDRLDEVLDGFHRRIGTPVLTDLRIEGRGISVDPASIVPGRLPDLFPGAPVSILGRYRGKGAGSLTVRGRRADGTDWSADVEGSPGIEAVTPVWARGRIRDLEDRFAAGKGVREDLEREIVSTSVGFQVLSRFTASVAIDTEKATEGGEPHEVVQPVEMPQGWSWDKLMGPMQRISFTLDDAVDALMDTRMGFGAASPPPARRTVLPVPKPRERLDRPACLRVARELADFCASWAAVGSNVLATVADRLETLVDSLRALRAGKARRAALEKLLAGLRDAIAAGAPPADEVRRLLAEAERVLRAFAEGKAAPPERGGREEFWK